MSFTHGKGTRTFINTTECSAFLNNVEQSISREMSETSVFGSAVKTYTKGLRDSTITLSGYWDGATDAIDDVMNRLFEGVNLLPPGDAVANYSTATNVTNAVTPISGFSASVYFADNLATRTVRKLPSEIVANAVYSISATVQMDDSSAPVPFVSGVITGDFIIDPIRFGSSVSLVSGSIYRVQQSFSNVNAQYNGQFFIQIQKATTYSAKGFRLAGLTLEATNLPNAISILDEGNTLGAKALVASAKATSYQVTNTVSDTVAVSAEFQVDGSGAFRGQVLAPLAVRGNNSASAALDNGVSTNNGLVCNIHMLNNAAITQVKIQHSSDGSTWADIFASYQTVNVKFAQSGATVGTVNRYLRTLVTTSGSPQILVTAARR